jgi:hypothetical protein
MGIWDRYKTDESLETDGVWNNYGDFRVKLARAGGKNLRYQQALERHQKKNQKRRNKVTNAEAIAVATDLMVTHCVLGWQTKVGDEWKDGIEQPDGSLKPCTRENVLEILEALPDLRTELLVASDDMDAFRADAIEEDAGN